MTIVSYMNDLDKMIVKEYTLSQSNTRTTKVYTEFEKLVKDFGTRQDEIYYICEEVQDPEGFKEAIDNRLQQIADSEKAAKLAEIDRQINLLQEKRRQIEGIVEEVEE